MTRICFKGEASVPLPPSSHSPFSLLPSLKTQKVSLCHGKSSPVRGSVTPLPVHIYRGLLPLNLQLTRASKTAIPLRDNNDTNSIIVRDGNEKRTAHFSTEGRYGRTRSGVDWLSRSDRMCWSLLGLAQTLAVELGLFEKQDRTKSQEDNERAQRIQQLLWVFSIQTSGRLGMMHLEFRDVVKC